MSKLVAKGEVKPTQTDSPIKEYRVSLNIGSLIHVTDIELRESQFNMDEHIKKQLTKNINDIIFGDIRRELDIRLYELLCSFDREPDRYSDKAKHHAIIRIFNTTFEHAEIGVEWA